MSNLIGQSLGRYHILEQLGEGGMATVYKAYDTRLERDVAVKVIRTEKLTIETMGKTLKRFEREAKALAKLTHPNIVPITDYGEHDGKPYLVMPYLPGGTLKQQLKGKPMPWEEAVRLLIPIARALHYAHQQGIIHRDVKPSNILITQSGEPMLTDFGIAKILLDTEETADLTGTGMGVGTPGYMSPEQFQGKGVDARTDIYSLGVVLYEMVTGRKPYEADTPAAILIKQAMDPLPSPKSFVPELPDGVEKVLLKALAKRSEDRYQNMANFSAALEQLGSEIRPSGAPIKPPLPARDKKVVPAPHTASRLWMIGIGVGSVLFIALASALLGWLASKPDVLFPARLPTMTPWPLKTLTPVTTSTPTPIPSVRAEDIIGTRWYSPMLGTSIEFFNDGTFVYSLFPLNVSGEGGSSQRGNYEFVGYNKLQVDGASIFGIADSVFDVKLEEGNILTLGENRLYELEDDFGPLRVDDNPAYHEMYLGYWENTDSGTRDIPALHIFVDEQGALRVHVWGSCHPNWCDWGMAKGIATAQFLYVYWDHGFAREHMVLILTNQGNLNLQLLTHFTDNSGRSDYSTHNEFRSTFNPTATPSP